MKHPASWLSALRPPTVLAGLLLPALLYAGNPAVALLCGAVIALAFDSVVIPRSAAIGRYALQSAIVLLGLKLNAGQLVRISADYSIIVTAYVLLTIAGGLLIGRALASPRDSSQLISSGTAICGGTAIASLSPVIEARPEVTGVALTLVFLLNALALFTFPHIGHYFNLSQEQFGVWAALAIHDTSSVVATGAIYGDEAATVATTVKLGRTLWLIPLLLTFSLTRRNGNTRLRVPAFVILFLIGACLNSLWPLPDPVVVSASAASKFLLVAALYCIGTEINRQTVRQLRGTPVLHALLLWAVVVPSTLALVIYLV